MRAALCEVDELGEPVGLERGAHVGGDAAAAQDEDPVARVRHLLGVAGHQQHRGAVAGGLADQGVDLGPGADVDALGGLVEQQHARLAAQPAGQHDLLGVAAGQRLDRLGVGGDPDEEAARWSLAVLLLRAVAEPQPGEVVAGVAGADVVPDALALQQRVELALLRARRRCRPPWPRAGAAKRTSLAAQRDGAAGDRVGAEEHAQQLAAARAEQPGDAEHLAAVQVERDAGERAAHEPAGRQDDVVRRARRSARGTSGRAGGRR